MIDILGLWDLWRVHSLKTNKNPPLKMVWKPSSESPGFQGRGKLAARFREGFYGSHPITHLAGNIPLIYQVHSLPFRCRVSQTTSFKYFKWMDGNGDFQAFPIYINWSNYSDLTRPHPKWWFSKGNHLISGKFRLVKYYNLARYKDLVKIIQLSPPTIEKNRWDPIRFEAEKFNPYRPPITRTNMCDRVDQLP